MENLAQIAICLVFHEQGSIYASVINNLIGLSGHAFLRYIFVLDSGSHHDPIPEEIVLLPKNLILCLYRSPVNLGYAAGNNKLIREALHIISPLDLLLVCNPDVSIDSSVVCSLRDIHACLPNAFAVSPLSGPSRSLFPSSIELIADRYNKVRYLSTPSLLVDVNGKPCLNTLFLTGSFIMFKQHILASSGLFDEQFFMYLEEVELVHRMFCRGFHSYISVSDFSIHNQGQLITHPRKVFYMARNSFLFARKLNLSKIPNFVAGRFIRPFFITGCRFVNSADFNNILASLHGFVCGIFCQTGKNHYYHRR